MISYNACLTYSAASLSGRKGIRSPNCRTRGGSPAMKCRSEPFFSRISLRNASISAMQVSSGGRRRGGFLNRVGAGDIQLRQHARVRHILLERFLFHGVVVGIVGVDLARGDRRE